jgi:methionyl-tRNA formyltransferase
MSKKRLIIFGNTRDYAIANRLLDGRNFETVGGVVDPNANKIFQAEQRSFLKSNNLLELNMDTIQTIRPDIGLSIYYSKIIPASVLSEFFALNIHAGLLPKWRGFNANCWAVINGEKEVGYTLHQMTECLDAGPIYYKFTVGIGDDEHYAEVIPKIQKRVSENISNILADIIDGKFHPISQDDKPHIYTTRLRPEVGTIADWNIKTNYLYNLYRVLGAPYGTGMFFSYKEKIFEITQMSKCKDIVDYIGICGVVVLVRGGSIIVKTADNVISIDEIKNEENLLSPASVFRIGQKL